MSLKITGVQTIRLDHRNTKTQGKIYTRHWPFRLCHTVVKTGPFKQEAPEE